jgi:photosystem II stability/assembly factor-like uncharacterized protein
MPCDLPRVLVYCLILASGLPRVSAAGPHFVMHYFYDQDKSEIQLIDLKFPSAQHGMAAGVVTAGKKLDPALLVTKDAGAHWSLVSLKTVLPPKDVPLSLYFVDDSQGWMVTDRGLWFTGDFGGAWHKAGDIPKGITRVWFLTTTHGWAIGSNKQVIETTDGGKSWTPVAAAKEAPGAVTFTVYTDIVFMRNHGIITGGAKARDFSLHPEWQSPESKSSASVPGTTIFLETPDGGQTWSSSSGAMFGQLTQVALSGNGTSLALFEFGDRMDSKMVHLPPSEVHRMSVEKGVPDRVYRDEDTQITDVALTIDGTPYLAGHSMVGVVRDNPIPGKLKVLTSADFTKWTEIPVDYRADAHRAYLAIAEDHDVWVATDTGMILKLE